jgi:hypothetical protein
MKRCDPQAPQGRAEMITRIVVASNVRPGHVVTMPSAGPHLTQRLMTDVELLLADTIASVTAKERMIVFQLVAVAVCTRCQEAYTEARRVIEEARGLAAWMEKIEGRARWASRTPC